MEPARSEERIPTAGRRFYLFGKGTSEEMPFP